MVKGTTRQVIWVKGTDEKLFEQAIFLVRDEALVKGGITEDALLKEAKSICTARHTGLSFQGKLLWASCGAGIIGLIWLLTTFFH